MSEQNMLRVLADVPATGEMKQRLAELPAVQTVFVESPAEHRRLLPREQIHKVDILFCTYPPSNFDDMAKLKLIQIASSGYAQLTGLGLPERGIRACNARGTFDVPIAEWNVAMMVALARNFRSMMHNQDSRIWARSAVFQSEIRGATVGIWGYGGIGRETARLAKALGMTVHVLTRNEIGPRRNVYTVPGTGDPEGCLPDQRFRPDREDEFLRDLDFLVVAVPLTRATEGLIGEKELRSLPRSAYVLNPARGPVIQERALLRALEEHWIAGAALDAHYQYPLPPEHPLWAFPSVILTPHISGSSLGPRFLQRLWDIFLTNVECYLDSKPLLNELTSAQLHGD